MKTLLTIVTVIVLAVIGLGMAFDLASNEVRKDAQGRIEQLEQIAK